MNRTKFAAGKKPLDECFSKENMLDKFYIDQQNMTLVVAKWIDEMPSKYRDIAADACTSAFETHAGRKANGRTLNSFVDAVYDNITKDSRITL